MYQEESKTDQEGYYRIRGLQVRVTQSKGRTTYFQTHCRIYFELEFHNFTNG
jgi:hypothetical protein